MTAKDIDEYISTFPSSTQEILEKIRTIAHEEAPDATEGIGYQIAAIKIDGKAAFYFAGWKHHVSMYPIPEGDAAFQNAVAPYDVSKGTMKMTFDKPIPYDVIRQAIRLHVNARRS